jgi:class 3 adenylate cyclase
MLPQAESACFVIADISGYTNFVSGVELDHAQDIIADIMDRLVRALRPPFRVAKFEGDATFVYALATRSTSEDATAAFARFRACGIHTAA